MKDASSLAGRIAMEVEAWRSLELKTKEQVVYHHMPEPLKKN